MIGVQAQLEVCTKFDLENTKAGMSELAHVSLICILLHSNLFSLVS